MRLSFEWLGDFVDLSGLTASEVADKLTMGAFEVEEVRKAGSDIEGPLVVGEIVEINPHPNADKIRLTRVKVHPDSEPLEIVCGASNIIVGQRVPVALPGARVINRHDGSPLPIKQSKIRGIVSNGMLCSASELGISTNDGDGILVLSGIPEIGTDALKLLHIYPDWVLHVEPRSNRGDALSVIGLAREVAALCGRPLHEPEWQLPEEDLTSPQVEIKIENLSDCPFFSLRVIEGLTVGPSPQHIARRLEMIGVRPISNVVDVTNYVLHELGQPLHAYDLKRISGSFINVRRARHGEFLMTLDGRKRPLNEDVLSIADTREVIGIAGVMGGKESEVTEATTFIALEAACFSSQQVRRSSRTLGLSSDSSLHFERGIDKVSVRKASDRAAWLLLKTCGGFLGRLSTAGSDTIEPQAVAVRMSKVKALADIDLSKDQATNLLAPLGFSACADITTIFGDPAIQFLVPSFRHKDVTREIDLIEELIRLHGYEKISASMPRVTTAPAPPDKTIAIVKETLSGLGLSETWISSLISLEAAKLGESHTENDSSFVFVLNPLSADHQVLRSSLVPGLINAASFNQDRGRKDVWLFEVGRVYSRAKKSTTQDAGATEVQRVAAIFTGQNKPSQWYPKTTLPSDSPFFSSFGFYQTKGIVENLFQSLSLDLTKVQTERLHNGAAWYHPGRSLIFIGQHHQGPITLGWLGELHPQIVTRSGLRGQAYCFELDLDQLKLLQKPYQFQEIYVTPTLTRDLTIDLPEKYAHQTIADAISNLSGMHLKALDLVSIFQPNQGVRSLSYRLTFQHPSSTLTSEQVDKILLEIKEGLKTKCEASFRL